MYRYLAIAAILAMTSGVQAAEPQTAWHSELKTVGAEVTPTEADIAFPDIFEFLANQVNRASTLDTFEAGALKNIPTRTVSTLSSTDSTNYDYHYGPRLSGKQASYYEGPGNAGSGNAGMDAKGTVINFFVIDMSGAYLQSCITFKAARSRLQALGWKRGENRNDGETIATAFSRDGVTLEISSFDWFEPTLEPWDTAASLGAKQQEAVDARSKRLRIDPESDGFLATCVTGLNVRYVKAG